MTVNPLYDDTDKCPVCYSNLREREGVNGTGLRPCPLCPDPNHGDAA